MSANYKLPNYTVYFDANVAYSKKPSEPISPRLLKSIDKARTLTRIDVRVPEVVLEELAYQQFVIAYAAGGALETVIDGVTGLFFHEQTSSSLAEKLRAMRPEEFSSDTLQAHAAQYDVSIFVDKVLNFVEEHYAERNTR